MNTTIYHAAWTCRHVRLWVLLISAKPFKEGLGRDEESSEAEGTKTTSLQSVLGVADVAFSIHHAQLHVDETWEIHDFESISQCYYCLRYLGIISDAASTN